MHINHWEIKYALYIFTFEKCNYQSYVIKINAQIANYYSFGFSIFFLNYYYWYNGKLHDTSSGERKIWKKKHFEAYKQLNKTLLTFYSRKVLKVLQEIIVQGFLSSLFISLRWFFRKNKYFYYSLLILEGNDNRGAKNV